MTISIVIVVVSTVIVSTTIKVNLYMHSVNSAAFIVVYLTQYYALKKQYHE